MSSIQDIAAGTQQDLESKIASRVREALSCNAEQQEPTVLFLRELGEATRKEDGQRGLLQVIASGRRLLGDGSNIATAKGRYTNCLGRER